MKAPIIVPAIKKRFQASFLQSYLKNEMLAGIQAAQICLRLEETPKGLLPNINNTGTVNPINGPEIHQGQGCLKNSITLLLASVCLKNIIP